MGALTEIKSVNEFLADLNEAVKDTPWQEAIANSLPWIGHIGEALADAMGPIKFLTKLWEKYSAITDVNEQGRLIGRMAFQRSVQQAFNAVVVHIIPFGTFANAAIDRDSTLDESITFVDGFSLDRANTHKFFMSSMESLRKFLEAVNLDMSIRTRVESEVSRRFSRNFAFILGHRDTSEKFREFQNLLRNDSPGKIFGLLDQHASYQRWLFEEQRVLNHEPFALQHSYIETDCGELTWKDYQTLVANRNNEPSADPFSEESGPRKPLLSRVMELIVDPKFKECIVVQGHAGAGKSSLTKRLCCELLDQGFRPIRIELKDLNVTDIGINLSEALPRAVRLADEDYDSDVIERYLPSNAKLEDAIKGDVRQIDGQKVSNYVLILDAWDEVSIGASEGYQQAIEKMLHRVRDEYLSERWGCRVRVILTGRPTDAVTQSGFLKEDSVILTMRSFTLDQLKAFVARMAQALKVRPVRLDADWEREGKWLPWELTDQTKLDKVSERYETAIQKKREDHALEILGLPLLCQLSLRLIAEWDENVQSILNNTTVLFRCLVDMLSVGAKPKGEGLDEGTAHLRGRELRQLLRLTAEAMSVRGVESINRAELESRLEGRWDDLDERVKRLTREHVLSRLLVSFFFKGGHRDLGCEFSHKSFREYLFAEQIIEELRSFGTGGGEFAERLQSEYWRDFDERDPRFVFSRRLAHLLGPNWLSREVGVHLSRLVEWEIHRSHGRDRYPVPKALQQSQSEPLTAEQWNRVRDGLADLWDWWGEGVHMRPQPSKAKNGGMEWKSLAFDVACHCRDISSEKVSTIVPVRMTTIDGHLGDGLFQLCADVHRELLVAKHSQSASDELPELPQIDWGVGALPSRRRYQSVVQIIDSVSDVVFRPTGKDESYFYLYCMRIEATGYRWVRRDNFPMPIRLAGVDLSSTGLVMLQLHSVDMRCANLSNSKIMRCWFPGADLRGANLRGAIIQGTEFYGVDFREAILSEVQAMRVDFGKAKLQDVDLSESTFSNTNFREATLTGARFQRAKGVIVDFRFAKLEGADFEDTEFDMVKVSESALHTASCPQIIRWKGLDVHPG